MDIVRRSTTAIGDSADGRYQPNPFQIIPFVGSYLSYVISILVIAIIWRLIYVYYKTKSKRKQKAVIAEKLETVS